MTVKLVYITAGAGGMFCGSCLHDNALAKALSRRGWDVQLVPFYTPIRTDEEDVSVDQVFFGGINVYLQQKFWLFRQLPKWLDGVLDRPGLIRRVTARAIETNAAVLGDMALSMLRGARGRQRKEVRRVVRWLKEHAQPQAIMVSNLLIAGFVEALKEECDTPVFVTLQGDDVFLNALPPADRAKCLEQIRHNNQFIDGFLTHSHAYRSYMSEYLQVDQDRIGVTPLGLAIEDFVTADDESWLDKHAEVTSPRTIGYLARLAPEKGLHHLVEAFIQMRAQPEFHDVQLRIAGWLGPENQGYAQSQWERLEQTVGRSAFEYLGTIERSAKLAFLRQCQVFSVPVEHWEPKGLFALEAMAAGTPVVLPARGAMTELVESSGGGLLFPPGNRDAYVAALAELLRDQALRQRLATAGRQHVLTERNEARMAALTSDWLSARLSR